MPQEIKPIDQCKTLQELFADPKRWTQFAMAKNSDGKKVSVDSHTAVCFCLAGGFGKIYDSRPMVQEDVRSKIYYELNRGSMVDWNDYPTRTIEDVQALVKKLNI